MKVVFIGAGAVFGFHSGQWRRAALRVYKEAKFFVVEPDTVAALGSKLSRLTLEQAAETCDLAIVNTPNYVRRAVCEPFVRAGKALVVEKPLTINWDEIAWFENAAKTNWICPVQNSRLVRAVEKIALKVQEEKDLNIRIKAWKTRYRSPEYYEDWHGKYATDGGVLAQQGFHCMDLVCWIGGEPVAVSAKGFNHMHQTECEDTAEVDIEFANGAVGRVECTTANPYSEAEAGLRVEGGWPTGYVLETKNTNFGSGTPGHTVLADRVFAAFNMGAPPPITVASVAPGLRALHAAYTSMDCGGMRIPVGKRHARLGSGAKLYKEE